MFSLPEVIYHRLGRRGSKLGYGGYILRACLSYLGKTLEIPHEGLSPCRPYPRNIIQNGFYLCLSPQGFVILYSKAVSLILYACNKLKALGVHIYRELLSVKIDAPCPVMVVLYHSADGYIKSKAFKHFQCDIDLAFSAVHKKQIRESGKAAIAGIDALFGQLLVFLDPMGKSSGKSLLHAGIIVRACHCPYPEFPVIALFRLTLFKHHHGSHILESVGVGNIKCLHPLDAVHL